MASVRFAHDVAYVVASRVSRTRPLRGTDVVVAIVGGVLLVAAISRPQIDWPSDMSGARVKWREIWLSGFAFFLGGYAVASLYDIVRTTPFASPALKAIWSAGVLIGVYGLVVHHDPFFIDGKFRWIRYPGWMGGWLCLGIGAADLLIGYVIWIDWIIVPVGALAAAFFGWSFSSTFVPGHRIRLGDPSPPDSSAGV